MVGKKRAAKHKTLFTMENTLRVAEVEVVGGGVKWVLGMKEGTCD